jgi:hypothetical protein
MKLVVSKVVSDSSAGAVVPVINAIKGAAGRAAYAEKSLRDAVVLWG